METITSRKNSVISEFRSLAADGAYRRVRGLYVLDGIKLLKEALRYGADVVAVVWRGEPTLDMPEGTKQYSVPADLFEYASPLRNSPGPLFAVRIPEQRPGKVKKALVLDGVQDPGNVGTVIRTANALNMDTVILTGACADPFSPKAARATMGALFRQRVLSVPTQELRELLDENGLVLYGAVLDDKAVDVRSSLPENLAVAIGSEGQGLSPEVMDMCDGKLIIPMNPDCESLNAAVAAAIIMWEICR